MFYPAYVHKDTDSSYGVTFPDFPGCFSAADVLEALPRAAQEAVEVYFDGEAMAVPKPSTPERWSEDERFRDGYWMLVDIDLSKVNAKAVRVNISLPEQLVREIDEFAKARHMSRSAFLATAAMHEMHAAER
jgi:predicted RNase H-like HicB family nuclease